MNDIDTLIDRLSDSQRREFSLWCAERAPAWVVARNAAWAAAAADESWDAATAAARDAERAAQRAELKRMLEEAKS